VNELKGSNAHPHRTPVRGCGKYGNCGSRGWLLGRWAVGKPLCPKPQKDEPEVSKVGGWAVARFGKLPGLVGSGGAIAVGDKKITGGRCSTALRKNQKYHGKRRGVKLVSKACPGCFLRNNKTSRPGEETGNMRYDGTCGKMVKGTHPETPTLLPVQPFCFQNRQCPLRGK